MTRIIIGIDPGLQGAIAAINQENMQIVGLEDTPTMQAEGKTLYDIGAMAALIRRFALAGEALAVIERQQARPKQGVSSCFQIGFGYGIWSGLLGALEIPCRVVHPATWTRKVFAGSPGEGKARAVAFAARMFPTAELVPPGCRKARDGRADAACLAYWGAVA